MRLQTLEDLLVHQIQDILSAEQQVKKALQLTSIAENGVNDAAMRADR